MSCIRTNASKPRFSYEDELMNYGTKRQDRSAIIEACTIRYIPNRRFASSTGQRGLRVTLRRTTGLENEPLVQALAVQRCRRARTVDPVAQLTKIDFEMPFK